MDKNLPNDRKAMEKERVLQKYQYTTVEMLEVRQPHCPE
jgi:hypothetical protein